MTGKKWSLMVLGLALVLLLLLGGFTAVIDPFFHYHAPLDGLSYELLNTKQRYINDGISRNFDYEVLITGTSMTENFSASLAEELYGGAAIKLPFEGASFREIDLSTRRAINANDELAVVVRSLDYFVTANDKDDMLYDTAVYPDYLYDRDIFNDVSYVLNKTVLFENTLPTLIRTARGEEMTYFDQYSRMSPLLFGVDLPEGGIGDAPEERHHATENQLELTEANISQNLRQTVMDNPQVDFYFFFPPYSLIHWNTLRPGGRVDEHVDIARKTAELLVDLDNAHVFDFNMRLDMIAELSHYQPDGCHYDGYISDMILETMASEEGRLTEENYIDYFDSLSEFLRLTDFNSYLQEQQG